MGALASAVDLNGVTFLVLAIFLVVISGYLIGEISIKGVSLGTAGVFITSILYGILYSKGLSSHLVIQGIDVSSNALKLVETIGLCLFVASVGLIAGPFFFSNLKKNFKSYILLGIIILSGGLVTALCFFLGRGAEANDEEFVAILVGLLSGALTSTPAFSASKATVAEQYADAVTVGHSIAYIFGVIGVVLFVQLVPKLVHADMDKEAKKITDASVAARKIDDSRYLRFDPFGITSFGLVIVLGILIGMFKIPLSSKGMSGTTFSLTTTGGVLIAGLVLGHFGHLGPVSMKVDSSILKAFQEFGLILFLFGAGVAGGAKFLYYFKPVYFLYGILMTLVPMIIGYFAAVKLVKLDLLNSLGCITGGMTSTPALGTLIKVAGTESVASAYAATYPIALITVVLMSQFLVLLL